MLFIITLFFSFFFPASALFLCPLCAHGFNDSQPCRWRVGSKAKNTDPILTGGQIEIIRDLSGCHLCRDEREGSFHLDCEKCLLPGEKLHFFFFLG